MAGSTLADPAPRLVSIGQANKEDKIRDELAGAVDQTARTKISLPVLRFMRDDAP